MPNVRVAYREETLLEELQLLIDACNHPSNKTEINENSNPVSYNNHDGTKQDAVDCYGQNLD